ncbi:PTS system ascorbate-specific IIA component [Lipingzhangella halophila]|uniref:Ascorbate-specific PTS system EIIA component n=1 Tax=Lipingzhangella halophila TaxID=1783352 RepID=A0A7W7W124_9ACTN|nr:PTS sugar transporter subunit IIA [Lipingzhangella halophila]MBB4930196.1 PTS system ascorbate-specific IIA component [Lipingzhangella halophila]
MEGASLRQLLPTEAIALGLHAAGWREAVRAAGDLLVATGSSTVDYIQQMQDTVDEYGPYIVIAPGLALAHARPSSAVLRTGLSWAALAAPVQFGHPRNDPVDLVVGLAATDHDGHSAALSQLARMLACPDTLAQLRSADRAAHVHALITEYEDGAGR